MKRTLCIVLAVLTVLASAFAFASCGGNSTDGTTAANPESTDNANAVTVEDLAKIKAAGQLVVGMECNYAPYNWSQTTENEYTVKVQDGMYADGYDVQISRKIAEALGVTLVIKPMEWDGLIPALNSGDIDMVIAGMSPTDERKLSIDFSDTYFDSNLVVVCKKDSQYASATSIADFSGAKLVAQQNTFHDTVIEQIDGVKHQSALPDFAALLQAVTSGSVDGYVCEKPGAESAVAANSDLTFVEFAEGNGFECDPADASIAVGIRKGSDLTSEINSVLATLTTADKEALMDAAISRQPVSED
jgi:putative lysine transport system substrate-binding protein